MLGGTVNHKLRKSVCEQRRQRKWGFLALPELDLDLGLDEEQLQDILDLDDESFLEVLSGLMMDEEEDNGVHW